MTFGDLTPAEHETLRHYVALAGGDHLDIGTYAGGSACSAAEACKGTVFTLDVDGKRWSDRKTDAVGKRVVRFVVSSHEWVPPTREFGSCFIDGDHTTEGVLADWGLCKSLKPKYIVMHDADLETVQAALAEIDQDGAYRRVSQSDKVIVYEQVPSP